MIKRQSVDWIQLEFFGGYWGGHYILRIIPDGTIDYSGELSMPLPGHHKWQASSRIYNNLAKILISRIWENEIDPSVDPYTSMDGWSRTLSWSIEGVTYDQNAQIDLGPESILKVIKRLEDLIKMKSKEVQLL